MGESLWRVRKLTIYLVDCCVVMSKILRLSERGGTVVSIKSFVMTAMYSSGSYILRAVRILGIVWELNIVALNSYGCMG